MNNCYTIDSISSQSGSERPKPDATCKNITQIIQQLQETRNKFKLNEMKLASKIKEIKAHKLLHACYRLHSVFLTIESKSSRFNHFFLSAKNLLLQSEVQKGQDQEAQQNFEKKFSNQLGIPVGELDLNQFEKPDRENVANYQEYDGVNDLVEKSYNQDIQSNSDAITIKSDDFRNYKPASSSTRQKNYSNKDLDQQNTLIRKTNTKTDRNHEQSFVDNKSYWKNTINSLLDFVIEPEIIIYTDGAYDYVNKVGGWGVFIDFKYTNEFMLSYGLVPKNNNITPEICEVWAIKESLEKIRKHDQANRCSPFGLRILVYSDCQNLVNNMLRLQNIRFGNNTSSKSSKFLNSFPFIKKQSQKYYKKLEILEKTNFVCFKWIRGHSINTDTKEKTGNQIADQLSQQGKISGIKKIAKKRFFIKIRQENISKKVEELQNIYSNF